MYPRDRALAICRNAVAGSHHGQFNELPVCKRDVDEFLKKLVIPANLITPHMPDEAKAVLFDNAPVAKLEDASDLRSDA